MMLSRWCLPFLFAACAAEERLTPAADRADPAALPILTDLDPAPDVVHVSISAEETLVDLGTGSGTPMWAFVDATRPGTRARVPGPTLVARPGDLVIVDFENRLSTAATTIHFHGVRLDSAMDGAGNHAGDEVFPGETFQYRFLARDRGTFWYHPHVRADEQVERGLQGAIVIRDDGPTTGHRERVLVLDDVDLDDTSSLDIEPDDADVMMGRHGDTLLVNGLVAPTMPARAGVERWRLVNAANGRYFELAAPGLAFRVIESDGGPLPEPFALSALRIAPGERLTVDVDLSRSLPGDIEIVTLPVDTGHGPLDEDARPLFTLDLGEGQTTDPPALVADPFEAIAPEGAGTTRTLELREWIDPALGMRFFINDEAWPFNTPWEGAAGAVEIWTLRNASMGSHPFHVHGMFFQVLDDRGRARADLGWKDTVDLPAGAELSIALRLERGNWMFHCQIPEHAERGMMGEIHVSP